MKLVSQIPRLMRESDRTHILRHGRNPDALGSCYPRFYSTKLDQLGNTQGDTFWSAARTIVAQTYAVLRPGGVAIWVTKRYVRDGKIVEFSEDWVRLCQSCGFELLHWHKAMLVEKHGIQGGLFGEDTHHQTARLSFFRRLHSQKYPELAILWEDVLCMRKPE